MSPFDNRDNQSLDKLEAIGLGANAATVLVALTLELRPNLSSGFTSTIDAHTGIAVSVYRYTGNPKFRRLVLNRTETDFCS